MNIALFRQYFLIVQLVFLFQSLLNFIKKQKQTIALHVYNRINHKYKKVQLSFFSTYNVHILIESKISEIYTLKTL